MTSTTVPRGILARRDLVQRLVKIKIEAFAGAWLDLSDAVIGKSIMEDAFSRSNARKLLLHRGVLHAECRRSARKCPPQIISCRQ